MKSVQFMPQAQAEKVVPRMDTALISITGPASEAQLKHGWTHLKRLEFHDADEVEFEGCLLFDAEIARDLISFLDALPETVEHVIVHCHAGISRSGAVAKFVADKFQIPFNEHYSAYNRLVYRTLRNVQYGQLYDEGLSAFLRQERDDWELRDRGLSGPKR
jgi:predicted protein tyrosine phosphatase